MRKMIQNNLLFIKIRHDRPKVMFATSVDSFGPVWPILLNPPAFCQPLWMIYKRWEQLLAVFLIRMNYFLPYWSLLASICNVDSAHIVATLERTKAFLLMLPCTIKQKARPSTKDSCDPSSQFCTCINRLFSSFPFSKHVQHTSLETGDHTVDITQIYFVLKSVISHRSQYPPIRFLPPPPALMQPPSACYKARWKGGAIKSKRVCPLVLPSVYVFTF